MVAGPSEITVVADKNTNVKEQTQWILLSVILVQKYSLDLKVV